MYSLLYFTLKAKEDRHKKDTSDSKPAFNSSDRFTFLFSRSFKILVILLAILMGVFTSNLFASDTLRPIKSGNIRHLFPKTPKVFLTKRYTQNEENTIHLKMAYGSQKFQTQVTGVLFKKMLGLNK